MQRGAKCSPVNKGSKLETTLLKGVLSFMRRQASKVKTSLQELVIL